ncbi:MAG: C25 family cysteine peptidase, partial [Desulfobacteraceae bacterium]|nr:C25 family cysteine peptidase [Desulfobacteraceae bacterium]
MRKFISAAKENLPLGFDPESFTERPIATVRESAGTIEVDYLFPGYYLIDDTRMVDGETIDFKQVVIANTGIISQSGRPALPSFGRYLRVPPGRAFKASVWTSPEHSVERNVRVFPAQMLLMDNPEVKTRFEYDKAFYDRETVYPKEMVSITGPYEIARKQGLLLHVSPFVYNPSTRQLAFHEKFRITISLTEPVARGKPQWGVRAWEAGGPLDNLFLNPGKGDGEGTASHAFFQKGYPETEFLIVYAQPFEKAARMLADWKNSRGIPTEIHSLDDMVTIGFNLGAHGGDMRALKKAIRHAWLEAFPFLRYILLLGDTDQIPIETIPSPVYGANHTDYYYSTGKGPEPPDSPLVFPVLALGRIPVRPDAKGRDSHAVFVIKKIIDYEKNPPSDSAYYKRMVFASSFENEPNTSTPPGHETRGCMEASEFVCSRL